MGNYLLMGGGGVLLNFQEAGMLGDDDEDELSEMNREAFGGATLSEVEGFSDTAGVLSSLEGDEAASPGADGAAEFASLEDLEQSILSGA